MPELPEVETIKLQLSTVLPGLTIKDVEVRSKKIFPGDPKKIIGKKVVKLRRFSKALVIDLNGGVSLVVHLKMTGQLVFDSDKRQVKKQDQIKWDTDYPTDKHTHVVITFTNGDKLYFNDLRKFGWMQIFDSNKVEEIPYVKKLGPEFLKDLKFEQFALILGKSNKPIKLVLMDQEKMGGLGNIYANDGLWCAKIDPREKANKLKSDEVKKLFNCLEKILKQAIIWKGASDNNYRDAFGQKGDVQNHFLVYNRQNSPCQRCGTAIKKMSLGGRGTYYCPECQKD